MLTVTQFPQEPTTFYEIPNTLTNLDIGKIFDNVYTITNYNSEILNNDNVSTKNHHLRSGNIKWIPQSPEWFWLYKKLQDSVVYANKTLWNFNLSSIKEEIQYGEYSSLGEDHYTWHVDIGSGHPSLRKLSLIVQLSDPSEYEGGDVEFFTGGEYTDTKLKMSKVKGSSLIFPSYMLHRVTPVTKGIRKSLVLWVGGSQFS